MNRAIEGFKTLAQARVEMQISDLDRLTADVIDRAKKLIEADRQKLPLHLFVVDLEAMVNAFEAAS